MANWRLSNVVFGFLTLLAMLAAWKGFALNDRPDTSGYGGDFSQFYTAGQIVARGESARLYNQEYFRGLQAWMREDPLRSLYPPTLGLAMSPLGRLTHFQALHVWWALQAACLLATAAIFYWTMPLPRPWRVNALLALAALLPVWIAVGIGHLAPMLLLLLAGGLMLHRTNRRLTAGLLLSLLAVKPQLAAGFVVWMLLRRDFRTLAGLALGGIVQMGAVAAALGPRIWLDYWHALPIISWVTRVYSYSPLFEQSFAGIASNLCAAAGLDALKTPAMRVAYAMTAASAAVALCRVVARRRPFGAGSGERGAGSKKTLSHDLLLAPRSPLPASYEYACGVLFMTIFPPYFLVYDQTLLVLPLVFLWPTRSWRWGIALWAVMTAPIANLSFLLGFSVSCFVALGTMVALAREANGAAVFNCVEGHLPFAWDDGARAPAI